MAFLLAERGRAQHALDELDRVVDTLDDPRGRARALAQRGGVLLDLGRHGEALDHYREALPVLRAADDAFWVRRVIWNRGLAHAFRHEFAPARRTCLAERLAQEQSLPLEVGFAQANLAFVLGLRGDRGRVRLLRRRGAAHPRAGRPPGRAAGRPGRSPALGAAGRRGARGGGAGRRGVTPAAAAT